MAAAVVAVIPVQIVGQVAAPQDVESDSNAAGVAVVNVNVTRTGQNGGFVIVQVPASAVSGIVDGPATLILSQGAGTVTQAVSQ